MDKQLDTHYVWHHSVSVCLFVCLVFNGTFSTNRLYRAIEVYHIGPGDNTNTLRN